MLPPPSSSRPPTLRWLCPGDPSPAPGPDGGCSASAPQVGQPHKVTPGSAPLGPCASHVALLGTFAPSHLASAAAMTRYPREQGSARGHGRAHCPLPSPSSPGTHCSHFLALNVNATDSSPRQELPDIKLVPAPRRFLRIVRPRCSPAGRAEPSPPRRLPGNGGNPPRPHTQGRTLIKHPGPRGAP